MNERLRLFGASALDGVLSVTLPSKIEEGSKENLEIAQDWLGQGKHVVIVGLHHSKRDVISVLKTYRRFLMQYSDQAIMPMAEHQYSKKSKTFLTFLNIDPYLVVGGNRGEMDKTREGLSEDELKVEISRVRSLQEKYYGAAREALNSQNGKANIVGIAIGATREAELTSPKVYPLSALDKNVEHPETVLLLLITAGFSKETNYHDESLRGYNWLREFTILVGEPFTLLDARDESLAGNFQSLEHLINEKFHEILPKGYLAG